MSTKQVNGVSRPGKIIWAPDPDLQCSVLRSQVNLSHMTNVEFEAEIGSPNPFADEWWANGVIKLNQWDGTTDPNRWNPDILSAIDLSVLDTSDDILVLGSFLPLQRVRGRGVSLPTLCQPCI